MAGGAVVVVVVLVVVEVAEKHVLLVSLCLYLFEFFRNYTKFAIKAYMGKSKINLAKKLSPVEIEHGTSCVLSDTFLTD